jgi:site-specific DNA recombinase
VFGPDRAAALAADLATVDDRAATERQQQRAALQQRIADITRRQAALLHQAQSITDPDEPWASGLRSGYNDLNAEKTAMLAAVADLTPPTPPSPPGPTPAMPPSWTSCPTYGST